MQQLMRDQIFVSYAHENEGWLQEFRTMLSPAERKGLVDTWSDERIAPGAPWFEKIQEALSLSRVGLLLVTPEFLASAFIRDEEMRALLAKASDGSLKLYWVPISATLFEHTELSSIQAAWHPDRPLDGLPPPARRAAVAQICRRILDDLGQLPALTRDGRLGLREKVAKILGDKYEILEEIGTGGSAIVYKAKAHDFDRLVAVKTLVASSLRPDDEEAFHRHIEMAFELRSPAYIRVFDHFLDESPQSVVVEYVEGSSLDRYIERSAPVPPRRVKNILFDLATALSEAHEHGYLHDGLMPSNVYIDEAHRPRISAFHFLNLAPEVGRWGTFLIDHESCTYLSPEQFKGEPRSQLSDQHTLGLLGYELLAGRRVPRVCRPADFVDRPAMYRELGAAQNWGAHSPALGGIVSRMLRVEPEHRWTSMPEIASILNDIVIVDNDIDQFRAEAMESYVRIQLGDGESRFFESFYRNLFELVPEVKAHFAETDMSRQYLAVNRAVKLLLDFNPKAPLTVASVQEVAKHHSRYGLERRHVDAFQGALLKALEETGQGDTQTCEAWRRVLAVGLDEMCRVLSLEHSSVYPERPSGIRVPSSRGQIAAEPGTAVRIATLPVPCITRTG